MAGHPPLSLRLQVDYARTLAVLFLWPLLRGASPRAMLRTRILQYRNGPGVRLEMHGVAGFTSLMSLMSLTSLRRALGALDAEVRRVVLDLRHVVLVDPTFLVRLEGMVQESSARLEIVGVEHMTAASAHPHSTRGRRR